MASIIISKDSERLVGKIDEISKLAEYSTRRRWASVLMRTDAHSTLKSGILEAQEYYARFQPTSAPWLG